MEDQLLNEGQVENSSQEEHVEQKEAIQQEQPVQSAPTPQESFRQLREKSDRAERERDEMRQALQQIYMNQQQNQKVADEDDPSELIERRHLKQYDTELKKMKHELQYTRQSMAESRLRNQYSDFDKVVNESTISEFRQKNPTLAASLATTDDLYEKGSAVYTLIKNMGIYREDNYAPDRAKAESNATKPRPTNTIAPQRGDTPLSHANAFANGLTDDLKKQLLREMEQARRGA